MILSIILTFFFVATFLVSKSNYGFGSSPKLILETLRTAFDSRLDKNSIILLASFFSWILLPMFWGLSFYLQSDANVVVVLFTFVWGYYHLKAVLPVKI